MAYRPQSPSRATPERLQKLYRGVAKCTHPDLETDEQECLRCRLMAEANDAYKEGDKARLQAILGEWDSAPQAVKGEEGGAELIRVVRKIAQVKEWLRIIAAIPQKNIKKVFEIAKNTFRNLKRKETDL